MKNLLAIDLDGTLEDSRADMLASVQRVRAALGLPARPDDDFSPHITRGMGHLYARCFDDHLAGHDAAGARRAAVQAAYEADYGAHLVDTTRLYEGIAGVLPRLAGMAALAVVTNKPQALSERLLEALGVRRWFAAVVGGDTCPREKPDPLPLRHAATAVGAEGRVVMIGDSPGDVRCGRDANAGTVWCGWGYYEAAGDLAPDATAADPSELPRLVRALLG